MRAPTRPANASRTPRWPPSALNAMRCARPGITLCARDHSSVPPRLPTAAVGILFFDDPLAGGWCLWIQQLRDLAAQRPWTHRLAHQGDCAGVAGGLLIERGVAGEEHHGHLARGGEILQDMEHSPAVQARHA